MTDNEIKKALEYCSNPNNTCDKCILFNAKDDSCQCASNLRLQALDLINRLEAENERLKAKPIFVNSKIYDKQMKQKNIKAEARKEFAEKIKEKTKWLFSSVSINNEVDNLLKEMDGE